MKKIGNWSLIKKFGKGGNSEVWEVLSAERGKFALKILKKTKPIAHQRFKDEIKVLDNNSDISGIMPVIDHNVSNIENSYYVMPIARKIETFLYGESLERKIDCIVEIARTLETLHTRGISHRDIKPQNILELDGRFILADFGLVDFEEKEEISSGNTEIGAKWTIAPEMRRSSSLADFKKADVYSLAKTFWIILTNQKKSFDGQYSAIDMTLSLKSFIHNIYTTPIDNLITICTSNNPALRPDLSTFIDVIISWQKINKDFHDRNLLQWIEVQNSIFPISIPKTVEWKNPLEIVHILKKVCSFKSLNHMFYPSMGGDDLENVRLSNEEGCIEMICPFIEIVKPNRLIFESFENNPELNYFRLEIDSVENKLFKDTSKSESEYYETVIENSFAEYVLDTTSEFVQSTQIENVFPRRVSRWYKGAFVFFAKRSLYNLVTNAYDAKHNKMSNQEFRELIENFIHMFNTKVEDKDRFFENLKSVR